MSSFLKKGKLAGDVARVELTNAYTIIFRAPEKKRTAKARKFNVDVDSGVLDQTRLRPFVVCSKKREFVLGRTFGVILDKILLLQIEATTAKLYYD